MSESELNVMPGWWHRVREFLVRAVHKALDDNIFFMAGAITFNLLVAIIPLLLVSVGIAGFVLTARFGDPAFGNVVVIEPLLEKLERREGFFTW